MGMMVERLKCVEFSLIVCGEIEDFYNIIYVYCFWLSLRDFGFGLFDGMSELRMDLVLDFVVVSICSINFFFLDEIEFDLVSFCD